MSAAPILSAWATAESSGAQSTCPRTGSSWRHETPESHRRIAPAAGGRGSLPEARLPTWVPNNSGATGSPAGTEGAFDSPTIVVAGSAGVDEAPVQADISTPTRPTAEHTAKRRETGICPPSSGVQDTHADPLARRKPTGPEGLLGLETASRVSSLVNCWAVYAGGRGDGRQHGRQRS